MHSQHGRRRRRRRRRPPAPLRLVLTVASRLRRQDGNALILMPVAVLIILGLGAVAIDSALMFRAHSELDSIASGLANDATSAVRVEGFFLGDRVQLNEEEIEDLVDLYETATATNRLNPDCRVDQVDNDATPPSVTITCSGHARLLFHHIVGESNDVVFSVSSSAEIRDN